MTNRNPSPELQALADIFDHFEHSKQAPGHCHDVPGIWDADNAPDKAGKPCEWCAKWERARAALSQTLLAPGEVERLRAALEQIDRINGGADWNGTRTIARAALAGPQERVS